MGDESKQKPFNQPRVAINRVYTRRGDQGQTALVGGGRVGKDSPRIAAYGTVDELSSFVGAARLSAIEASGGQSRLPELARILTRVQHELFNLGSILATLPQNVHPNQPRPRDADVSRLEDEIDRMNQDLPELRSFVLPGGSRLSVELHQCRTICRRAERLCVGAAKTETIDATAIRYLNRLSDAFFVWSRWADHVRGVDELLWDPNLGAKNGR